MKDKFLVILKEAFPQGYSPLYTSDANLQAWREEMACALEVAAQPRVQSDFASVEAEIDARLDEYLAEHYAKEESQSR